MKYFYCLTLLFLANFNVFAQYEVTNTNDSGAGSLRDVITNANASSGETITFNIAGAGPHVIIPTSAFPNLTSPMTIDGYSQLGASENTQSVGSDAVILIEIDGVNVGGNGFTINNTANCTIKGLSIHSFQYQGIKITGVSATNNVLLGNYIGVRTDGETAPFPTSRQSGIQINNAPGNYVGDGTAAGRNVLSGNGASSPGGGIDIVGVNSLNNFVLGNYIGTDETGNTYVGNEGIGIEVRNGASYTTIGGASVLDRNVVSGNNYIAGIFFSNGGSYNTIEGNYVGVGADGSTSIPNNGNGVRVTDANSLFNTISANIINNNTGRGITLGCGNNNKDFPVILSETATTISGTCESGDIIEVFDAGTGDQGQTYLGTAVTTGTTWSLTGTFNTSNNFTATATAANGNTSEFSRLDGSSPPAPPVTPSTQVSGLVSSNYRQNRASVDWTNGNGNRRLVVASTSPITWTPTDDVIYNDNSNYGNGASLVATDTYVIYEGSSNSPGINGLTHGTTYYIKVFEFEQECATYLYNTTTTAGNSINFLFESQASNISFSNVFAGQMDVSWTNGGEGSRILVAHEGSTVDSNPANNTNYPVNSIFGDLSTEIGTGNFVVYNGTGSSVTMTGLAPGETYHFRVYEYNGTVGNENYNVNSATGNPASKLFLVVAAFTIDAITDANVDENSAYTSVTPSLSGAAPVGTVTYTLGGADAAAFTIAPTTGIVSMVARDFENPGDANTDNIYELTITATDTHSNTDTENWTVTVNDVVEAATFTIDVISDASVNENTAYTSVTPAITGTPIGAVTYTISGGTDAADFTINGTTGVVSLVARDFESPADANTDNIYELEITVTDADGNLDAEVWTVTVNDVIEAATFTIDAISDASVNENTAYTSVTPAITGTPIGAVTYTISGGTDAADFTINGTTGVVSMGARNFESPADANTDNIYEIEITVTDADGNLDAEVWTVTVNDVVEAATFTIDAISDTNVDENTAYTSVTPAITGTPIGTVTYTISGGADQTLFTINGTTGVISMVARNFESPADANTDNIYEIEITVTDADGNLDAETWTVIVNDIIEVAVFAIDVIANANVNENTVYTSVTPSLSGATPIGTLTYTLGGADVAAFTINSSTGVVSMVARDFEAPSDANTNNIYEVTITATDSDGNNASENWTVIVNDVIEVGPTITSFSPTTAGAGETITIIGTDFTNVTSIVIGGVATTDFVVTSSTTIEVVVPTGATSGSVEVTAQGGTASLAGFTIVPAPTITSFSPTDAAAGETVIITGTDFTNVTSVVIGGVTVTDFVVTSSGTIEAVVPVGATSGSVEVTAQGGTASLSGFTFVSVPEPDINVVGAINGGPLMATFTEYGESDLLWQNEITIQNNGTADLLISNIYFVGTELKTSYNGEILTLQAGGSYVFFVGVLNKTPGIHTDQLVIESDDPDESSFTFPVEITYLIPIIEMYQGTTNSGIPIIDAQVTPVDVGNAIVGTDLTQTFVLENIGNLSAQISDISVDAAEFSVNNSINILAEGNFETFTITLNSTTPGVFNSNVTITRLIGLGSVSYSFPIVGEITSLLEPEIAVFQGADITGIEIINDQTTAFDFGNTDEGVDIDRIFTLENAGNADLNINSINLNGADFTIIGSPPTVISAGTTESFTIRLSGAVVGTFKDQIVIANNDTDESLFTFEITGAVNSVVSAIPNIEIQRQSIPISGVVEFGTVEEASTVVTSFTISNTGTADLLVESIASTNPVFTVAAITLPSTISSNGTTTFDLVMNASGTGVYQSIISIVSNDPDESPYEFNVRGVVEGGRVILVITNTDNSVDRVVISNEDISLGQTTLNQNVEKVFGIENLSDAEEIVVNSITVDNPAFEIVDVPSAPIIAGDFALFTVRLMAENIGIHRGTVTVSTSLNDFSFVVVGEVVADPITNPDLNIYNVVTPNGDGIHDFLKIGNIEFYTDNKVIIYDRWGGKVFEVSGYDNVDNIFVGETNVGKAKDLDTGNYYYVIDKGNGDKPQNGFLFLKR